MNQAVFAGYGTLALNCLKLLIKLNVQVSLVLTHKDKSSQSVDSYCEENGIRFVYSDLRKDNVLLSQLSSVSSKFLISVNYRYIIPKSYLDCFEFPLNLHGSLLPKYRGRTPHVWAIINGEKKTGITCHVMEESVDTGDIFDQVEINISPEDTGAGLLLKFEEMYPGCLERSLKNIENNIQPLKQNHQFATYYGKRIPEMGAIDFSKTSSALVDFIRAQAKPYPGAYCYLGNGKKVIVNKALILKQYENNALGIGNIVGAEVGFVAKTVDGYLHFVDAEYAED
ncbi:methionyl-tRNA formyltransferase [Leptospira sp. 'Mane']|uniref:methionyl-tRNA formyltransferase n=1 Tax=Leptospira sp. 'Mane' TaxID=3387407 RepID=UPI00398A719B